jgi:hypothetical protein
MIMMPALAHTIVDDPLHGAQLRDVSLAGDDAPAVRLDLAHGFVQVGLGRSFVGHERKRFEQIHRNDVGPLLREAHRMTPALPARRAGDEGNLVLYPTSHWELLNLPNGRSCRAIAAKVTPSAFLLG